MVKEMRKCVVATHSIALIVPNFGCGVQEKPSLFAGFEDDVDIAILGEDILGSFYFCFDGLKYASLLENVGDASGCVEDAFEVALVM